MKDQPDVREVRRTSGTGILPPGRKRTRTWRRHIFRRWIRPFLSRPLSNLGELVVPSLYLGYLRLVWATSRVEEGNFRVLHEILREHNGAVGLLWHEEVFTVAYAYAYIGFRPHTLASAGRAGEIIARTLKRCGFVVFRGGSTTHRSRRREGTLQAMIDHMQSTDGVIYGLTVDGSKGPPYRIKSGGIVIARECRRPIVLVRTWYKRCLRLRTWDRMAVPLPFNVIRYYLLGPYFVPEDAHTEAGLEKFRRLLEHDLIDLARRSYDDMGQTYPPDLVERGD